MIKHKKYALYIGRWQPFHLGHKYIIDQALKKNKNIAIAIRDTEISEKNPYTVEQRLEMIKKVYEKQVQNGQMKIFPIVDIESINIGRKVGYDVNRIDVPEEIKKISGTKIRNGKSLIHVAKKVREYLITVSPTFWFFGLPCSGKSTLAKELKKALADKNNHIINLDGDVLRNGLNKDLGFSSKDRQENLRRAAHLAKLFNEKGHTSICAFVTPRQKMRKMITKIIGNVCWIYTKCSVEECARRDVKGMYKQAKAGKIKNFTGISAPFDEPDKKENAIIVDTENNSIKECLKTIIQQAKQIDL